MSTPSTTIYDLIKDVPIEGTNLLVAKKKGIPIVMVGDGLRPRLLPLGEGHHVFDPEELLALRIEALSVNGRVIGYQREPDYKHARRVARALLAGKPFPPILVAIDSRGRGAIVDGQHRAIAAVMAGLPIEAHVKKMSQTERAELFFGQRNAKTVDRNVLVLAGTGPFDRYVQQAVSTDDNAWSDIVSANRHSKTRITPYAMYQLLIRYVGNAEGQAASHKTGMDDRWDRELADELAPLIACFGNKQTNPLAFKPAVVQAIGSTALWVFRRHATIESDRERWERHMPTFPFRNWIHVTTQQQVTSLLIEHWNKRLSGARRVVR